MIDIVIARSLAGLVLSALGLVVAVRLYRRTCAADLILILLAAWFLHGVVYYVAALYFFTTFDPYPLDFARMVNIWSTALRFQIALSLIGIMIWHPGRVRQMNG